MAPDLSASFNPDLIATNSDAASSALAEANTASVAAAAASSKIAAQSAAWEAGITAAANLTDNALIVGDGGAKGVKTLALGAANLKLFMNAAGTANEYASGIYLIEATRDLAAETGDVSYTGVGFAPSHVAALLIPPSGGTNIISIGFGSASSATGFSVKEGAAGEFVPNSDFGADTLLSGYTGVGNYQIAAIKSMDADGLTLTWTLTGSPTGIYKVAILCFR